MNYLITGAQFHNKGAQSLLFSTMSEIYVRDENATIFYLPLDWQDDYIGGRYNFNVVYDDECHNDINDVWLQLRKIIKIKRDKVIYKKKLYYLSCIWDSIDILYDISGYQLSSKFSDEANQRLLRYINTAIEHSIKTVLLPQSFGPFDYKTENIKLRVKQTLKNVDLIFAREYSGMKALLNSFSISDNVIQSPDVVLQTKEEPKYVYIHEEIPKYIDLITKNNVGIIPNRQTIIHGSHEQVIEIYKMIIDELIKQNFNVYIFRHSDDLEICKEIYNLYSGNKAVSLIENDMSCFEFGLFIKQFNFIVGSRYHAIVHAYKEHIPAVILGWSDKYVELAKRFSQAQYVFDITKALDQNLIKKSIVGMADNWEKNSVIIEQCLKDICKENCFDIIQNRIM